MEHPGQQPEDRLWLQIHDKKIDSEALVTEVERRVEERRAELGVSHIVFPTFGHISTYPEPPLDEAPYNPNLYYYLKQANRESSSGVEPVLVPSPATRVPILGRLWQLVRAEFHQLVLFYVNKSVSEQNKLNINVISTLNELTRVTQLQQAEIDKLRAELRSLKRREP